MKLYFKIFLLLIIIIAIYFIFPRSSDKLLYLPKEKSNLVNLFDKQDTPLNSLDAFILKFFDFKDGWVRVKKSKISKLELYSNILNSKREKTRKMVMYEGATIEDFIDTISKQANLDKNRLLKKYRELAYYKEGDIVARKYSVPFDATESSTMAYILNKSHNIYQNIAKEHNITFPSKEFKNYLIIASLISKETQNRKEMPLISAVIYNRLKKDMKLQLDASLNYGKNRNKIITPQVIKNDNSKYNTYKYKGLPPEPICSSSKSAILAAINPKNVDYLYFVKSGNSHKFSKKYINHKRKVGEYKKELKKRLVYRKWLNRIASKKVYVKLPTIVPYLNTNGFKP